MSFTIVPDAWNDPIIIVEAKYIEYRNRTIFNCVISEIRVKGRRVLINSYKTNTSEPKMTIICKNVEDAENLQDILVRSVGHSVNVDTQCEPPSLFSSIWTFLGCKR